jgi:hypothetical protein
MRPLTTGSFCGNDIKETRISVAAQALSPQKENKNSRLEKLEARKYSQV